MFFKEEFCKKGSIVFINPHGHRVPCVVIFTDNIDEINNAEKKSGFITVGSDSVNLELSGYNYYVDINLADKYLQLSDEQSNLLKEKGKISIPLEKYNPICRQKI